MCLVSPTLRRFGIFAAAGLLVAAVSIKPVAVYAMGTDTPYRTTDDNGKKKKKKNNNVIEQCGRWSKATGSRPKTI